MSKLLSFIEKILVFSYFLLLPSQTAYHLWLSESFLFGRKIDYLSPTLYVTQLISAALLLYWLYQEIVSQPHKHLKLSPSRLLIAVLIVANCFAAQVPVISFYRLATLMLSVLFFIYLHRRFSFVSPLILYPLSLSLIWTSLLAWLQWFSQSSVGSIFRLLGERPLLLSLETTAKVPIGSAGLFLRSYATFPHPNALAGFLLLFGLFLLLGVKNTTSRTLSLLLKSSFLFSMFTLPLTFSRTSFWALLSLPIVYIWMFSRRLPFTKISFTLILFCLLIVSLFIPGNPASLPERLSQYSHAFSLIVSFPIFGVGLGNYLYFSPASLLQLAHDFWLLAAVELGLPLSGIIFYKMFRLFRKSLIVQPSSLILIWPLLITSLTDSYWFTLHQNTSAAIFILVYLYYLSSPKQPRVPRYKV